MRNQGRMADESKRSTARLATLDELIQSPLQDFLAPVPCKATLRDWFDRNHVQRMKANPSARRGGGPNYYSRADVEKLLRSRMMPGNFKVRGLPQG